MVRAASPDPFSAATHLFCAEDSAAVTSWDDEDAATAADAAADKWLVPPFAGNVGEDGRRCIADLLAAEPDHMPRPEYLPRIYSRAINAAARHRAVSWILKVNEFYRFRPVTAYLSVNYLDRFLSSHSLPHDGKGGDDGGGGWPMQLLSVACVSVAAKMEETHVPLLLDLQILDPRFVFEPRTIRRMELLLMGALRWRMRSVTPFDFLPHLAHSTAAAIAVGRSTDAVASLLSRASDLILRTRRVVDFLSYRPSAIAAAAVLCAADDLADPPPGDGGGFLFGFCDSISKDQLSRCRQLMEEHLLDNCRAAAQPPPTPPSPIGVLDAAACGSCDLASSVVNASLSSSEPYVTARAEPVHPAKRRRLGELRCTENI